MRNEALTWMKAMEGMAPRPRGHSTREKPVCSGLVGLALALRVEAELLKEVIHLISPAGSGGGFKPSDDILDMLSNRQGYGL